MSEKFFVCPKCKSVNVRVHLTDGTILKSLGSKLSIEVGSAENQGALSFSEARTICLECEFEFCPKCLDADDVI